MLFITGDRSVPAPFALTPILVIMLHALAEDPTTTFATGDNEGVESAVALVGLLTGIDITVVPSPRGADGRVDWDARHAMVLGDSSVNKVIFVHGDPLTSRIGASLARADDARVEYVTPPVVA